MGLKYYLGDIQARRQLKQRLHKTVKDPAQAHGKLTLLARGLIKPPPGPGKIEYIVVKKKQLKFFEPVLAEHKVGEHIQVGSWVAIPRLPDDTTVTSFLVHAETPQS
jgi:hypothetical protein